MKVTTWVGFFFFYFIPAVGKGSILGLFGRGSILVTLHRSGGLNAPRHFPLRSGCVRDVIPILRGRVPLSPIPFHSTERFLIFASDSQWGEGVASRYDLTFTAGRAEQRRRSLSSKRAILRG